MSLNYDLTKILVHDPEREQYLFTPESIEDKTYQVHPWVREVIFGTMHIGICRITEDNYVEFYKRLRILLLTGGHKEHPEIDLFKVQSMIGLTTNASPLTDAAFFKSVCERLSHWASSAVWLDRQNADKELTRELDV